MLAFVLRLMIDARFAASLIGGQDLVAVCNREAPRCVLVREHKRDLWMNALVWQKAVRVGWLKPESCIFHSFDQGPWSTRGAFGTVAAYTLHHLPGDCWPAWALDVPVIAAWAAERRSHAASCERAPACMSWRRHRTDTLGAYVEDIVRAASRVLG
jgi:hypothetical protein